MQHSTEPTLRCRSCGEVKPIVGGFYADPKKRSRCRVCIRVSLTKYGKDRAEYMRAYKLERGCMDCGYSEHGVALDFDHRPDEEKLFPPSSMRVLGTWQQMLDEIAKCDVVCANCHRVRTFSRPSLALGHDLKKRVVRERRTLPREHPDQLGLFGDVA